MKKYIYDLMNKNDIKIDYDVFEYGWINAKHYLIFLMITLPFVIYFNIISEFFIFILLYLLLRRYIGGFHFQSNFICILVSIFISISIPLLSKNIQFSNLSIIIVILLLSFLTIKFVPIDHPNKRLSQKEKNLYKRKSILLELFFIIFLIYFKLQSYCFLISIIICIYIISIISLLLSIILNE